MKMNKMKKVLAILMASAMAASVSITAFAEDTTKNIYSDTAKNTATDYNKTEVYYKAQANENATDSNYRPAYIVEIPAKVTLSETADVTEYIKIYGKDTNSNVFIESGKEVRVGISASENSFNVKNGEIGLAYTVNEKNSTSDLKRVAYCPAASKVVESTTNQNTLKFSKLTNVQYAGEYKDTLTFNVSIESAATTP